MSDESRVHGTGHSRRVERPQHHVSVGQTNRERGRLRSLVGVYGRQASDMQNFSDYERKTKRAIPVIELVRDAI
ncbi:hypothetical protein AB0383_34595 [Amycolatopsis sp. NPDC051373]|uniref:hypothetical protein n=1 Tax=Amycolatopsis sp. NPDC051373 TaxID=3155801 RepID=UPI00344CDE1D